MLIAKIRLIASVIIALTERCHLCPADRFLKLSIPIFMIDLACSVVRSLSCPSKRCSFRQGPVAVLLLGLRFVRLSIAVLPWQLSLPCWLRFEVQVSGTARSKDNA